MKEGSQVSCPTLAGSAFLGLNFSSHVSSCVPRGPGGTRGLVGGRKALRHLFLRLEQSGPHSNQRFDVDSWE